MVRAFFFRLFAMVNTMTVIRILPANLTANGAQSTQGTKVMVGDVEVPGVYAITLRAEPNDVWRCELGVHAFRFDEICARLDNVTVRAEPLRARLARFFARAGAGAS